MKKFLLIALILLVASSQASAQLEAIRITASTVSYSTVGVISTFNSITDHLYVENLSVTGVGEQTLYVTISSPNIGWQYPASGGVTYLLPG